MPPLTSGRAARRPDVSAEEETEVDASASALVDDEASAAGVLLLLPGSASTSSGAVAGAAPSEVAGRANRSSRVDRAPSRSGVGGVDCGSACSGLLSAPVPASGLAFGSVAEPAGPSASADGPPGGSPDGSASSRAAGSGSAAYAAVRPGLATSPSRASTLAAPSLSPSLYAFAHQSRERLAKGCVPGVPRRGSTP